MSAAAAAGVGSSWAAGGGEPRSLRSPGDGRCHLARSHSARRRLKPARVALRDTLCFSTLPCESRE